jgi:hypothetical protein
MKDQSLLTPASIAGQLKKGWAHLRTEVQPGIGSKPKPQLSLMEFWQSQLITTARTK